MRNIVDLSVFQKQTLALRLPNGETIQISKPTQRMVIELLKFKSIDENSNPQDIVEAMDNMVLAILNNNEKMVSYTQEQADEMLNVAMKMVIIQHYAEFVQGIQQNPN